MLEIALVIILLAIGPTSQSGIENQKLNSTNLETSVRQFQMPPSLLSSQYTEGNTYDIMSVVLLASLGVAILPSLSTFLTYLVASNKNLFIPKRKKTKVRSHEDDYLLRMLAHNNSWQNLTKKLP